MGKYKHGYAVRGNHLPEYDAYRMMKVRCYTKTNHAYKWYGARGIKVCRRWLSSVENFLKDVGRRPSPELTIERIDVNGNYEPGNVRWATRRDQFRNTRRMRWIE